MPNINFMYYNELYQFLMIEKAKLFVNSFEESKFNYAHLIWMFCRKTCYSKIEKFDHKIVTEVSVHDVLQNRCS